MGKNIKKLIASILCVSFVSMQATFAEALIPAGLPTTGTVLGDPTNTGNFGANIQSSQGGFAGYQPIDAMHPLDKGANLYFNNDAVINWGKLNVANTQELNFLNGNAAVLNNVLNGMSNFAGRINGQNGHIIISNPNGMMINGGRFETSGSLTLTTQNLVNKWSFDNGKLNVDLEAPEASNSYNIIALNAGKVISKGEGDINIISKGIDLSYNSDITANGNVSLTTFDGRNFRSKYTPSDATNNIAFENASSIQIANSAIKSTGGNITLNSGDLGVNLKDASSLTAGKDISVTAIGSIVGAEGSSLVAGKDVTLLARGAVIDLKNTTNAGGKFSATAKKELKVKNVTADSANLKSASNYVYMENMHINGIGANEDSGKIVANGKTYVDARGITAKSADLSSDDYVTISGGNNLSGGDLTINAGRYVAIGNAEKTSASVFESEVNADNIYVTAGTHIGIAGIVDAQDTIKMNAGGGIYQAGNVVLGGNKSALNARIYELTAGTDIGSIMPVEGDPGVLTTHAAVIRGDIDAPSIDNLAAFDIAGNYVDGKASILTANANNAKINAKGSIGLMSTDVNTPSISNDLSLTSDKDVYFLGYNVGNNADVKAGGAIIANAKGVTAGNDLNLVSNGKINISKANAGNKLTATSDGLVVAKNVTAKSADLTSNNAHVYNINSNVGTLKANAKTYVDVRDLTADSADLNSQGHVVVSGITNVTDALTATADKYVAFGDAEPDSPTAINTVVTAGTINAVAGTNVGYAGILNADSINFNAANGGIYSAANVQSELNADAYSLLAKTEIGSVSPKAGDVGILTNHADVLRNGREIPSSELGDLVINAGANKTVKVAGRDVKIKADDTINFVDNNVSGKLNATSVAGNINVKGGTNGVATLKAQSKDAAVTISDNANLKDTTIYLAEDFSGTADVSSSTIDGKLTIIPSRKITIKDSTLGSAELTAKETISIDNTLVNKGDVLANAHDVSMTNGTLVNGDTTINLPEDFSGNAVVTDTTIVGKLTINPKANSVVLDNATVGRDVTFSSTQGAVISNSDLGGLKVATDEGISIIGSKIAGQTKLDAVTGITINDSTTGELVATTTQSGSGVDLIDSHVTDNATIYLPMDYSGDANITGTGIDGTLTIYPARQIKIADSTIGGNTTLTAKEDVTISGTTIGDNNGPDDADLLINAANVVLDKNNHINGDTTINLPADFSGDATISDTMIDGTLTINPARNIKIADSTIGGDTTLTAKEDVTISGTTIGDNNGPDDSDLLINAGNVVLEDGTHVNGDTTINLPADFSGNATITDTTIDGTLTINPAKNVKIDDTNIGGDTNITAGGDVDITDTNIGGDVDVVTNDGDINVDNTNIGGDAWFEAHDANNDGIGGDIRINDTTVIGHTTVGIPDGAFTNTGNEFIGGLTVWPLVESFDMGNGLDQESTKLFNEMRNQPVDTVIGSGFTPIAFAASDRNGRSIRKRIGDVVYKDMEQTVHVDKRFNLDD